MDSYQGSIYDPVSLHKYLYANANPVKYTDPSGKNAALAFEGLMMGSASDVNRNYTDFVIGMRVLADAYMVCAKSKVIALSQ